MEIVIFGMNKESRENLYWVSSLHLYARVRLLIFTVICRYIAILISMNNLVVNDIVSGALHGFLKKSQWVEFILLFFFLLRLDLSRGMMRGDSFTF